MIWTFTEFYNFRNQTSDASPTGMPVELLNYFNHHMFRSVELVNVIQFDLLDFWWKNEWKYPIVYAIAKDLITSPVTTIILESTFSASKWTLFEVRSKLKKDILEELICLKDWQYAYFWIQNN